MDGFAFTTEFPVRYRDLDTLNHVNNAVYGTYVEQARIEYFREVLGVALENREMVIAHVELDFRRPVVLTDGTVEVGARVTEFGSSSFEMTFEVHAGGDLCAEGRSVQVATDDEGAPRPVPDAWRDAIEAFEADA